MRAFFPAALLAAPALLAVPAWAQVGGPVGGPAGGPVGSPVGGPAGGPVAGPAIAGIGVPALNSIDDENPAFQGTAINAGRGVDFFADVSAEYGTNLLRLGDGQPLRLGARSREDLRVRPSITARAGLPLGRQQLYLNATVGRDFYTRNTFLNRARLQGAAGLAYQFGRCNGRVQADYSQRQTRLEEFEEIADSLRRQASVLASVSCPGAVGLSPDAQVGYTWISNSLASRRRLNNQTLNAAAGVNYAFGARAVVGARATYARVIFPNEPVTLFDLGVTPPRPLETFNYGLTSYGASLTGRLRLGTSLNLVGNVGYGRVSPRRGLGAPFGSLTYDATLGYTGPRLSGSVFAARDITPGQGGEATYFVGDRYGIDVGYSLGSGISTYAGATRSRRQFRGDPGFVVLTRTLATNDRAYVGARTRVGRLFTLSVEGDHQRRRVNPSTFNYDSTGVRLSLGATF